MMHLEADVFRKFDKQWALVTAGTPEHYNTMTISWGGMAIEWGKPLFITYVRESRFTKEFLDATGEFTVNLLSLIHI